jgi:hypothetical protein
MDMKNTQAYYDDTAIIMAVKSFIVETLGAWSKVSYRARLLTANQQKAESCDLKKGLKL